MSRLTPWFWRAVKLLLGLALVGGGIYWYRFSPLAVDVHVPQRGTVVAEVMGTGTLEARVSTTISPKIAGRIAEVLADQGQNVQQGHLLVRLDDDELKQQVAIAEANVDAAKAAIIRLDADKGRVNAVFDQARRHHTRMESLRERSAITQEELERAAESLAVAIADVARAEAATSEGQKQLISAEKNLEYHRARLQDTHIKAPFDGLIVSRERESGDVVVPGSRILTLISLDTLWIESWVDETEMTRLKDGQSARIVFRSQPERGYPGKVIRLGNEADRETREFQADIQVLELPSAWAVGQRAEVYIETDRQENALLLPPHLLVKRKDGDGVFVAERGQARWRPVLLGLRGRDTVEVLTGLQSTDSVLSPRAGAATIADGRRVQLP
jgi:RND family efflux transporter MFP subunit